MATGIIAKLTRTSWKTLVVVGLVLDLAISGVLVWLAIASYDNSVKAKQAAKDANAATAAIRNVDATQYQLCQDGNATRTAERGLWRALFAASAAEIQNPTPHEKQQIQKEITTYLAIVDKTFAPQTCHPPTPAPLEPTHGHPSTTTTTERNPA